MRMIIRSWALRPSMVSRPALQALRRTQRRWLTTDSGETKEVSFWIANVCPVKYGHWDVMWFLRSSSLRNRISQLEGNRGEIMQEVIKRLQKMGPEAEGMAGTVVDHVKILPRLEEGGILVRIRMVERAEKETVDACLSDIRGSLSNSVRNLFNGRAEVHDVLGRPYLTDLPILRSQRLKVEVEGHGGNTQNPTVDALYARLRSFGKLKGLSIVGSPTPQKTSFTAYFADVNQACSASVCLHRAVLPAVTKEGANSAGYHIMVMAYDPIIRLNLIKAFFKQNSRVIMPTLLTASAVITYTIFEPVRVLFVERHLASFGSHATDFFGSARDLMRNTAGILGLDSVLSGTCDRDGDDKNRTHSPASNEVLPYQRETLNEISELLNSGDKAAILVLSGPRGTGKSATANRMVRDRSKALLIHCPTQDKTTTLNGLNATSGAATEGLGGEKDRQQRAEQLFDLHILRSLIKDTGMRPSLLWLSTLQGYVEKILQASTGIKASFASTAQTQTADCLKVTTFALQGFGKTYFTTNRYIEQAYQSKKPHALHDDNVADEHEELKNVNDKQFAAENGPQTSVRLGTAALRNLRGRILPWSTTAAKDKPVVIIEGFNTTFITEANWYARMLALWAVELVEADIAHVIFVTDNNAGDMARSTVMTVASPAIMKKTRSITMQDAPEGQAIALIERLSGRILTDSERTRVTDTVGGRLSDLFGLGRLLSNAGTSATVDACVDRLVEDRVDVLRRRGFGLGGTESHSSAAAATGDADGGRRWNRLDFLAVVDKLVAAKDGRVSYDDVLMTVFRGKTEQELRSIATSAFVDIDSDENYGRTGSSGKGDAMLQAESPLYLAAMRSMMEDRWIMYPLRLLQLSSKKSKHEATVRKCEEELLTLTQIEAGSVPSGGIVAWSLRVLTLGLIDNDRATRRDRRGLQLRRAYVAEELRKAQEAYVAVGREMEAMRQWQAKETDRRARARQSQGHLGH
eukprot:Clim_evm26s198 gene=Clim_evmTU26s198